MWKPPVSGKITLVGDSENPLPGFIYYYPIIVRDQPVGRRDERRRAIIGFVFCPSRMADLMQGLLGPEFNVLALEIYDGARPSAAGLMFDDDNVRRALRENDRPSPWLARELRFGGHSWVAYFEASPSQPDAGCDRPVRPGLVQEAERQIRPRILIARPDDPTTSQSG